MHSKTPDILAYAGQNTSAAERDNVRYFEQKGVKFAFIAYTTYINASSPAQNDYGVTQYSRTLAGTQIAEAVGLRSKPSSDICFIK